MAGGNLHLHLHLHTAPVPIPLNEIENILFVDESDRKTPGWAIALAVVFFPIGLLFLLCKKENPQSRITIYVKGNLCPSRPGGLSPLATCKRSGIRSSPPSRRREPVAAPDSGPPLGTTHDRSPNRL
jgi:hypothetical protein